jgi:hypothetical protein
MMLTHGDTSVVRRERMRGYFMGYLRLLSLVMPGLDPGIHHKERLRAKKMDCRVISAFTRVFRRAMPGNDGG